MIKAGRWELGIRHRETVLRAQALGRHSSSGERIEQLLHCFGCFTEIGPGHVLPRYMCLSGSSEKLGHALRILFADCWVFREMQQGTHATTTRVVKNARHTWRKLGLPSVETAWIWQFEEYPLFCILLSQCRRVCLRPHVLRTRAACSRRGPNNELNKQVLGRRLHGHLHDQRFHKWPAM